MRNADLHIHTFYSDGSSSPEEVINDAKAAELDCIAITDHDTIEGVAPTKEAGAKQGIEVISGVELSTEMNGRDIHMLGYLFDEGSQRFQENISKALHFRETRMKKMIDKLEELGIGEIDFDDVAALANSPAVGRPHLAQVMLDKGYVSTMQEAFDKYLADGASAYIPKFKQTPAEGIHMIKEANGVAVLAHPMVTQMDEIIPSLVESGLDGLEVYYPNTPGNIIEYYEGLAQKHGLLMTGGSDAHGEVKKNTYVGRMKIPYELVEQLKQKAGKKS